MSDAPERIWLQDGGDYATAYPSGEVTWCPDPIDDSDTEYVRADRLEALEAENKRLREALNTIAYHRDSISGTKERSIARAALSTDGGEG